MSFCILDFDPNSPEKPKKQLVPNSCSFRVLLSSPEPRPTWPGAAAAALSPTPQTLVQEPPPPPLRSRQLRRRSSPSLHTGRASIQISVAKNLYPIEKIFEFISGAKKRLGIEKLAYSRRARALLPWRASAESGLSLASRQANRQSNGKPFESMETSKATPTRPPHPAPASPSPSPSSSLSLRLWRPRAQRNVRNQWSHLKAAKDQWLDAVADGRSHASALVNTHVSLWNMPATNLGVLKNMPGISDKANSKLARREEQYSSMLLSAYKEMVRQLSYMVKASHSMRCFSNATPNGAIMQFSDCQDDLNDSGDGGGAPVFKWFSILEFENLAQELVEMFVSEQKLKRLLLLGFLSITLNEGVEHQTSLDWGDELYDGESNELQSIGLQSGDTYQLPEDWSADILGSQRLGNTPSHEVLQVYLTAWLTNMNIKLSRIDEIFELVEKDTEIKLS